MKLRNCDFTSTSCPPPNSFSFIREATSPPILEEAEAIHPCTAHVRPRKQGWIMGGSASAASVSPLLVLLVHATNQRSLNSARAAACLTGEVTARDQQGWPPRVRSSCDPIPPIRVDDAAPTRPASKQAGHGRYGRMFRARAVGVGGRQPGSAVRSGGVVRYGHPGQVGYQDTLPLHHRE